MGNVIPEPDQLTLFDLGVDLKRLREQQAKLMNRTAAANTEAAYSNAWKQFLDWCGASGRRPLPASEETVCLYLTHVLEERKLRVATAVLHKGAIAAMHRASGVELVVNGGVSVLLSGARRLRAGDERPRSKAALTVDEVRRMVRLTPDEGHGLRDRALLCVGFASGMRRSELSSLDLADVEFKPQGVVLHLRKAKTDQLGRGRDVGLIRHTGRGEDICPVRSLRAWLKERGPKPGPLFTSAGIRGGRRLFGQGICRVVQDAAERIGLERSKYGAHSLRAGLVTSCLASGASELAVMQRTGHKNVATLQRYFRPASVFAVNPLAAAL